jgi:hypothetical protein
MRAMNLDHLVGAAFATSRRRLIAKLAAVAVLAGLAPAERRRGAAQESRPRCQSAGKECGKRLCCANGLTCCNGRCRDLRSHPKNCLVCGKVCPGGVCNRGRCACSDGQDCPPNCQCLNDLDNKPYCGIAVAPGCDPPCGSNTPCPPGQFCADAAGCPSPGVCVLIC